MLWFSENGFWLDIADQIPSETQTAWESTHSFTTDSSTGTVLEGVAKLDPMFQQNWTEVPPPPRARSQKYDILTQCYLIPIFDNLESEFGAHLCRVFSRHRDPKSRQVSAQNSFSKLIKQHHVIFLGQSGISGEGERTSVQFCWKVGYTAGQ